MLPLIKQHTCTVCGETYRIDNHHFFLYANGNLVSLKCKVCYGSWRKALAKEKKNDLLKLKRKASKITTTIKRITAEHSKTDEIDKILRRLNWTLLGSGASRMVYGKGPYALKIEYYGTWVNGKSQTEMEIENYAVIQKLPKELRELFLPILEHGANWILMPRVKVGSVTWDEITKIKNILSHNKVYIRDIHDDNVGRLNGKTYIFDYGVNCMTVGRRE
jgi:predicted nucleic acid-binding OB-fold protein